MYDRFVHLDVVGGAHVANIVLGLAIGRRHGPLALRGGDLRHCDASGHPRLCQRGKAAQLSWLVISLSIALALTVGG